MLSVIVAYDSERGIGKDNGLLWRIPADLQHFKRLTTGHPIIMGRKTYQSIGRPLPNRTNIVITRQTNFTAVGATVAGSMEEALAIARKSPGSDEIFVIGGGEIYTQATSQAERVYATEVTDTHGATVFFPELPREFTEISRVPQQSDGYRYEFVTYELA